MTPSRPTRATVDGRAYLDLQNLARRQHRPTDELHQLYALEGFLARRGAEEVLVRAVDALQGARYVELAEARPAAEAFVYGWLANRVGGHG